MPVKLVSIISLLLSKPRSLSKTYILPPLPYIGSIIVISDAMKYAPAPGNLYLQVTYARVAVLIAEKNAPITEKYMLFKSIPQNPVSETVIRLIISPKCSKCHTVGKEKGLDTISRCVFKPEKKHHHKQYT